jgi:hypothetical protein
MKNNKENNTILNTPRKLLIPDNSGNGNHITMVINWNPFIKNCEYIKLIPKDGKECVVQKDEFRSLMMMIAKEEELTELGKTQIETVRSLQIPVRIQLSRNYKKGEIVAALAQYKFRVPENIIVNRKSKAK